MNPDQTAASFLPISIALLAAALQFLFFKAYAARAVREDRTLFLGRVLLATRLPVAGLILLFGGRRQVEGILNLDAVFDLSWLLLVLWLLLRLLREGRIHFMSLLERRREATMRDHTNMGMVVKILQIVIVLVIGLAGLQKLGVHIGSLLALGGIGGLVFGLAAKDLLSNFFGGLVIYMDRPFEVGDWIRCPENQVEGVVHRIGWRMTHVLTFDKRFLYIPNASFTTAVVENPSRMLNRRVYQYLGVRYKDHNRITGLVDAVRKMLREHPEIDESKTLIVNLDRFSPASLDFFIYAFTHTTDWVKFHGIKQDIMLRVLQIIEAHGAECAFPTTTVHLPDLVSGDVPSPWPRRGTDLPENASPGE